MNRLLFLATIASLLSCHRHEVEPLKPKEYPVDPLLKEMFYFNTGSFWVLEDSVSGDYDTLMVTDIMIQSRRLHSGSQHNGSQNVGTDTFFRARVFDSNVNDEYIFEHKSSVYDENLFDLNSGAWMKIIGFHSPIFNVAEERFFNTNLSYGDTLFAGVAPQNGQIYGSQHVIHEKLNEYSYKSISITGDVYHFTILNSLVFGGNISYYWAPKVGPLRISTGGKIYNLVKYHVIPLD